MPRANARAASRQSVYKNEGVYSATQGYAGFSFVSDGGTPPAYYATNADVAMGVALTSAPWFLVEFVIPLQGDKGQTGDGTRGVYIRSATTPTAPTGTWDGSVLTLMGGWSATIPTGTDILYRADATLDSTNNTVTFSTPERWTGPTGPEPTDTRLNTLITTLLTSMDLTTQDEVNDLIQQYLDDNAYRTDASIREIINEAYQNVLRDLGAIQVQYALNPTSDTDWHDSLTFYDRHRIRLNNPDADWNIIMGGSVSTGGLSLTFQYTSDITDATLYHDSPQVDTDTDYRFKVGTGDFGDWQQIGGGGGGASSSARGAYVAKISTPAGTYDADTIFADWEIQSPEPLWERPFDREFGDNFKGYHATNPNIANFIDGEFVYNSTDAQWRILASGAWVDDTLPNILNDATVIDLGVQTSQMAAENALSAALPSSDLTLIQDANLRDFFDDRNDDTDGPFDVSRLANQQGRSGIIRLEFENAVFNFANTEFTISGRGGGGRGNVAIEQGTNTYTTTGTFSEITRVRLNSLLPISGTVTITALLDAVTQQSLRQVAYFDNGYKILRSTEAFNKVYAFDTFNFEDNAEKGVLMLPLTGVSGTQKGFIFDLVKNDVIVATYTRGFVPPPEARSKQDYLFTFLDDKNVFDFTYEFEYPSNALGRYTVQNQFLLRANPRRLTHTLVLDPTDILEVRVYFAN